jgi:uracil-DNA glycosylase
MPRQPVATAAPLIPAGAPVAELRELARTCQACPLWKDATQTVFGEGGDDVSVMFVGEVPGNDEDRAGKPFVGPAGRLLDEVLVEAGIDRRQVYVTNAVKHFKYQPRGKRRIHQKPSTTEIQACIPWLRAEIAALGPRVIVCLGATAAQALLGKAFRVTQHRGELIPSSLAPFVMATVHPSSVLRAPEELDREALRRAFVADMQKVAEVIRRSTELRP